MAPVWNTAHGFSSRGEEVAAAIPVLDSLQVHQTDMGLMDQRGRVGISRATADRSWAYAKVWLYCEIAGGEKPALG
jgi:hypothetical protein